MEQQLIKLLLLLFFYIPFYTNAQTSIGIEAGANFASNIPSINKTFFLRSSHPGLDAGFFVEKTFRKKQKIAIRTSLQYSLRFFFYGESDPDFVNTYRGLHCITLPVMVVLKASSKLSFDFGIELIGIVASDLPYFAPPRLHLGPKATITYRINSMIALRLYGVYDLIKIRQDNAPNSTNFNYYNQVTLGLHLAYAFKNIKKRSIIRSPGI